MGHAIKNMSASPDLLWALTRKTNAFMVKRNGLQLSSDPNNIMGKHCFKFSGLANAEMTGQQPTRKAPFMQQMGWVASEQYVVPSPQGPCSSASSSSFSSSILSA